MVSFNENAVAKKVQGQGLRISWTGVFQQEGLGQASIVMGSLAQCNLNPNHAISPLVSRDTHEGGGGKEGR